MIPINNSDTAWLIVSDYNQDNAIGYPDALREDIIEPDVDQYIPLIRRVGPGGADIGDIGGAPLLDSDSSVGSFSIVVDYGFSVGSNAGCHPSIFIGVSTYVGGNSR